MSPYTPLSCNPMRGYLLFKQYNVMVNNSTNINKTNNDLKQLNMKKTTTGVKPIVTVLPRSIAPRFLAYRQNSHLSRFPPLKIPRYTAKLSYRHPPQVFRHKSRKTNLNSPVSTAHNYPLTAVY